MMMMMVTTLPLCRAANDDGDRGTMISNDCPTIDTLRWKPPQVTATEPGLRRPARKPFAEIARKKCLL